MGERRDTSMTTRDNRRRVLMISHVFPPAGGSGVQRMAKFAQYLPEFGWTPVVWTRESAPELPADETLLGDLPADLDRRSAPGVHPSHAFHRMVDRVRRGPARTMLEALDWRFERLAGRVSSWWLPDAAMPWAMGSVPGLWRMARRERPDAILSTFGPASNHLLGWLMKRWTGRPWVADFRDLWTDNFDFDVDSRVRRRMRAWLERKFLEAADVVVGVSDEQTRVLAGHLPGQQEKFVTIPNGVDLNDFSPLDRARVRLELGIPEDRFVLSHVGSLVSSAEPSAILNGVGSFKRRTRDLDGRFEFRIVGSVPAPILRRVVEANVSPMIRGYVTHGEAVRETLAADCLILGNTTTGPNCASIQPGKVFEYLAAGRPILHVGPAGGACDRLIVECHAGVTVGPEPERISAVLHEWWIAWQRGALPPGCDPERVTPYGRQALTGRLAGILDRLVAGVDARSACLSPAAPVWAG